MALRGCGWMLLLGLCLMHGRWSRVQGSEASEGQGDSSTQLDPDHASLYSDLLKAYHTLVIPRTPVNVDYGLSILQIDGLDEKGSVLRVAVMAMKYWSDDRFRWDPSEYSGIRVLRIPANKIWQPDIRPYAQVLEDEVVNVQVSNNGRIYHLHPMRLAIPCNLEFANYPFDSHICDLKVESWTHDTSMINISSLRTDGADLDEMRPHSLWKLQSATVDTTELKYLCCEETYKSLTFHIQIKRGPTGYAVRVLAPSVVTSLLILLAFLIPPACGERTVYCSVLLLCILVQFLHLNLSVPLSGPDSPFVGDFLCFSVFLAFFATIESVLSFNLCSGIWGDKNIGGNEGEGEFPGVQAKANTAKVRIARIIDIGCFCIFTFIFAIVGGVLLNPDTE